MQRLFEGGDFSRVVYIRGWCLFEGGTYSREALIQGQCLFEGGALFEGGVYSATVVRTCNLHTSVSSRPND